MKLIIGLVVSIFAFLAVDSSSAFPNIRPQVGPQTASLATYEAQQDSICSKVPRITHGDRMTLIFPWLNESQNLRELNISFDKNVQLQSGFSLWGKEPQVIEATYDEATWELTLVPKINGLSSNHIITMKVDPKFNKIYQYHTESGNKVIECIRRCNMPLTTSIGNKFNGGVVIKNAFYRSKNLGAKIGDWISELIQNRQKPPRTIVSMHVMGYDKKGDGGDYNLEEIEYAKSKGMVMKHSYGEGENFAYFDGTDPRKPVGKNIYSDEIIKKFIPSHEIQKFLQIENLRLKNSGHGSGNLDDFLKTLGNVIHAPWPVTFHCKGGRHKTGMIAAAIRCLQDGEWWYHGPKKLFIINEKEKGPLLGIDFVELPPAGQEYAEFNRLQYRQSNIDFLQKFCDGELFETPEQLKKWIEIKKEFDRKLAEENLSYQSCTSINEFEEKYYSKFKTKKPFLFF